MKKWNHIFKKILIILPVTVMLDLSGIYAQEDPLITPKEYVAVSVSGGLAFPHVDFRNSESKFRPAFGVGVHYFSSRFLQLALDFQKGMLKGGVAEDRSGVKTGFENSYMAFAFCIRFAPLGLIENKDKDKVLQMLSDIYIGTGIGYISSDVTVNQVTQREYGALPFYKGGDLMIPIELGFDLPLFRKKRNILLLNLNLRSNFCFTDEIDGYVPTVEANHFNDAYSALTCGLIYKFGL